MKNTIIYVAMDTHKKDHKIALRYPGDEQFVQFAIKNTACDIKRNAEAQQPKQDSLFENVTGISLIMANHHALQQ